MNARRREQGLLIQQAGKELVVYDIAVNKAHCLSPAAATVWNVCDGEKGIDELAACLGQAGHGDRELAWMILHRLDRMHLLEESITIPAGAILSSRRDLMRKVAVAGGISILGSTIVAPTALKAQSAITCGLVTCYW